MSISGIQSANRQDDIFASRARANAPAFVPRNRNNGPDTVLISDEARAMAGAADAETDTAQETTKASSRTALQQRDKAKSGVSLREQGMSLFGMMLEGLFMADLEESAENNRAAQEGLPKKQSGGLMQDTGKVAEMKKTMNDVMTGKADISDLPKAMAFKSNSGHTLDKGVATAKHAGTENTV